MSERGIIYVAIGEGYREMARSSVESLKRHHPKLPVKLWVEAGVATDDMAAFDEIAFTDELDPHVVKARAVAEMPFERSLFLDADTWVCLPLDDAFNVLSRFDVAGARGLYPESRHLKNVPAAFPELNTGVLFFRRSQANQAMLSRWVELVRQNVERFGARGDQAAFREALYFGEARYTTLPSNYNVRFSALTYLYHRAAILHGHGVDLEHMEQVINRTGRMRIFDARSGKLVVW